MHDEALVRLLGTDLPDQAMPTMHYAGVPRLIVPETRTELAPGEALTLKVIVLDNDPARSGALYWPVPAVLSLNLFVTQDTWRG